MTFLNSTQSSAMLLGYLSTLWRRIGRLLLPLRCRIAHILYRNPQLSTSKPRVIKLDPWTVLKHSLDPRPEADALIFVREHTSIPIPALQDIWCPGPTKHGFIRMSLCPGVQLGTAWPNMSLASQSRTITELKSYITELRLLTQPTPPGWVGSTKNGPVCCPRLSRWTNFPRGPWKSGEEFHSFLLEPLEASGSQKLKQKFTDILSTYHHHIVFSHADLSFENILVDQDTGRVTAILDWEMAGWWPEYWEYRKCMYGSRPSEAWWVQLVNKVMTPWREEYILDSDLEMF